MASAVIRERGGWPYHLLTEDIEFTVDTVIHGEMIGYCGDAMLYDEQPTTFSQSWTQRMRWAKGFYQIVANYGGKLSRGIVTKHHIKKLASYDLTMTVMPGMLITMGILALDIVMLLLGVSVRCTCRT